jgi:hypothetical protein
VTFYEQLTQSEQDLVDRICDDWEVALGDANAPSIEEFLARATSTQVRLTLLVELLTMENELLWMRKLENAAEGDSAVSIAQTSGSADLRKSTADFLETVRDTHAELQQYPESFARLVALEFTLAQGLNHPPSISDYLTRFADVSCLEPVLRACLYEEWPTRLRLAEPVENFQMPLVQPVHLGRQRSDEPPPLSAVNDDDGILRVIVAPVTETRAARNHVRVEMVSRYCVLIANISRKSEVLVDNSIKLLPGGKLVRSCPCEFQIVDLIFRVEAS